MSSYLLPNPVGITIEDKKIIYSIRNRTIDIPSNFPGKFQNVMCPTKCGKIEEMKHLYTCQILNNSQISTPYEHIFEGDIKKQIKVLG